MTSYERATLILSVIAVLGATFSIVQSIRTERRQGRADERAERQAEIAANTVSWRADWTAEGVLSLYNESAENVAYKAGASVTLQPTKDHEPFGLELGVVSDKRSDVQPRFPIIVTPDLAAYRKAANLPAGWMWFIQVCTVVWETEGGHQRRQTLPHQIVTLLLPED